MKHILNDLHRKYRFSAAIPGTGLTVFLSLGSIIITLYLHFQFHIIWLPISLFLLMFLSVLIAGILAKRSLTPRLYGKLVISGRNIEEILNFIARKSLRIHRKFERATREVDGLFKDIANKENHQESEPVQLLEASIETVWQPQGGLAKCRKVIKNLQQLLLKEHEEFKRMEQLMEEAALELRIPKKRFVNHIIQFSPELFISRISKFKDNLAELSEDMEKELSQRNVNADAILTRILGLVKQLNKIRRISDQRIDRANDLIKYEDLHGYIHRISSSNSISEALLIYSETLAKLSRGSKALLIKSWDGDLNSRLYQDVENRFKLVFRKQKAYPGYDPHEILLKMFEYHNSETSNDVVKILSQFKKYFLVNKHESLGFLTTGDEYKDLEQDRIKDKIIHNLGILGSMGLNTKDLLSTYKQKLVSKFKHQVFPSYFNDVQGVKFVITHGYSKTIRQIIKHGLDQSSKWQNYVFILEGKDSSQFESQLMKFELQNETSFSNQYFSNISIGDISVLKELICNEDKVMIILGAECFDKKGRIVVAKGIKNDFQDLVKYFDQKNIRYSSVVASEEFKGQMESISNSEPFDDHFDRIDIIINGEDVKHLITEKNGEVKC